MAEIGISNYKMTHATQHTFESLGFSLRARTSLTQAGIRTVKDLLVRTDRDLIRLPNLGRTTLASIVDRLTMAGLALNLEKLDFPKYRMDRNRALEIINSLASGVDPITEEVFPTESALQHPNIVRALFLAAIALQSKGDKPDLLSAKKDANLLSNAGKSWSQSEDHDLVSAFELGATEKQLAVKHERTMGAIRSRLVKQGKLEPYGMRDAVSETPPS